MIQAFHWALFYPRKLIYCEFLSILLGVIVTSYCLNVNAASYVDGPDLNGKYTIEGINIRASFVPYGASISNLFLNDSLGIERDIVGGWDNASYYTIDKQHPHFGGVPGRYANRIKNSSFTIDGIKWNVTPNENPTDANPRGIDTLHGGTEGWDWRNWTLLSLSQNSITFYLEDPDGKEGFPGEVICYATYTMGNMTWNLRITTANITKKTPIMLSSHVINLSFLSVCSEKG